MKKKIARLNRFIAVALTVCTLSSTFTCAQESAREAVEVSTAAAAVPAGPAAKPTDNKQLYSAISDLNYKIEYLQSNYNRMNIDIEGLREADRDQKKLFDDRISALPMPDMSRIENLETTSALMRSEISQIRADVAEIKGRSDYRAQAIVEDEKTDKILRSPWIAVAALGIALIAFVKK